MYSTCLFYNCTDHMQRVPCQSHGIAKGECLVTSSGLFPVSIQDIETSLHGGNDDGTQFCHENANGLHTHLYHIYLKNTHKAVYITCLSKHRPILEIISITIHLH
jgi:hypothetical protein